MNAPVIVAGAGGGLVGALRAAELGRDVVIVETSEHFRRGNNTSMSTAMIPAMGTRWQQAAGVQDSPERFVEDVRRKTGGQGDERLALALAQVSAELVTWLADTHALPITLMTDMQYPGHSALRCHTLPSRHGSELLDQLLLRVGAHPRIDWLRPAHLSDVQVEDGQVVGVTVTFPDGEQEQIPTDAVLLATNGYGGDRELVRQYQPEIADAVYFGSETSRGDALRIGRRLGAATAFLDAYQGHAALAASTNTFVGWGTVMHGAVMVDVNGERFGDETIGYSEYAALLAARPQSTGWIILDERIHQSCLAFTDYRQTVESGALVWADSVEGLSSATGLPNAALQTSVSGARQAARGRCPDPFGRRYDSPQLQERLGAVRVAPTLFHTQGGLLVDEHARVTTTDGSVLHGLYASGGAAAGFSGHGAAGYLAGNGLLPALGLAYLAAQHLARTP